MIEEVKKILDNEAVELPKFKASLDRLLNKRAYDSIFSVHSITLEDLPRFVEKAVNEGNALLIQREWNTYMVVVWKDIEDRTRGL